MNTENPNSIDKIDKSEPPASAPTEASPAHAVHISGSLRQLNGFLAGLKRRLDWRLVGVLLVALIALAVWRAVLGHAKETVSAAAAASALKLPTVAVGRVVRQDLFNEKPIPAEFRAYVEVDLHAKVSGYVKEITVDFGDQVKTNQLLATLEVPELRDELNRALAAEKRAQADYTNAHQIYTRLLAVNKEQPNAVAEQEVETAEAKDRTTDATIAATKADVERYQTLLSYTRITAPFDGVVTHRYVDKGALIQAGTTSETQSLPVVRVSDNYRLRLDFPVSVDDVKDIHVGDTVKVRVVSLGDKWFNGTITRATLRVNMETRTMITEIEVPNPNLELVPGMYAEVLLRYESRAQALAIPIEAVPPGHTNSVYVINARGEIEDRPVSLGMDTPTQYEVTDGLKEGELVLVGNRSLVHPGERVETKLTGSLAQQ